MSDEQDSGGSSPPEPVPQGAERFKDFRVQPDGSVYSGGELIERGALGSTTPPDAPLQVRDDDTGEMREFTKEEVKAILKERNELKARAQDIELTEERIAPYATLIQSEAFAEILEDAQARGVFDGPTVPAPRPEDVVHYKRLQERPDFEAVRQVMQDYADHLPPHERQVLDSNYRVFNDTFKRFVAAAGDKPLKAKPIPIPSTPAYAPGDVRRILQAKEVAKNTGVVQKPGGSDHEGSERAAAKRDYRSDLKLRQTGDNDTVANVLMKHFFGGGGE